MVKQKPPAASYTSTEMMPLTKHKALAARLICLVALAASAACSQAGNDNGPANNTANSSANKSAGADAVRAGVSEVRIAAGGSGEAVVRLRVAEGFHINANPASDKYLIPTSVEAREAEGLRAGAPVYPQGVTKKFGFSEKPLAVYEGEVTIRLPVSAAAGAAKGRRTLDADVTVQPCDDKECFQPRKINAAIPVVIE
jgi:hypothetical protein